MFFLLNFPNRIWKIKKYTIFDFFRIFEDIRGLRNRNKFVYSEKIGSESDLVFQFRKKSKILELVISNPIRPIYRPRWRHMWKTWVNVSSFSLFVVGILFYVWYFNLMVSTHNSQLRKEVEIFAVGSRGCPPALRRQERSGGRSLVDLSPKSTSAHSASGPSYGGAGKSNYYGSCSVGGRNGGGSQESLGKIARYGSQ